MGRERRDAPFCLAGRIAGADCTDEAGWIRPTTFTGVVVAAAGGSSISGGGSGAASGCADTGASRRIAVTRLRLVGTGGGAAAGEIPRRRVGFSALTDFGGAAGGSGDPLSATLSRDSMLAKLLCAPVFASTGSALATFTREPIAAG